MNNLKFNYNNLTGLLTEIKSQTRLDKNQKKFPLWLEFRQAMSYDGKTFLLKLSIFSLKNC